MSLKQKKFKKLRKELQYHQSELEYVEEVLKEWHHKFEDYQREYCIENDIDLAALNHDNAPKVEKIMQKGITPKKVHVDFKAIKQDKQIKRLYKELAKKLHPDAGGDEKEFKVLNQALTERNFEKILDICDKHDILVNVDDDLIKLLKKQISATKEKIKKEKSTYSWSLYSCEENEKCKRKVMKNFLRHLFNYQGD
tara:strand:+ start:151 stop:738 length:588 start_codon:yes stop_codon:yes gene_type:complete